MFAPPIRSCLTAALLLSAAGQTLAQHSSAFTYQGSLLYQGQPYTGDADFRFGLWVSESGGAEPLALVFQDDVIVEDGLFTETLDFGAWPLTGDRWLEIRVRTPAWDGVGDEPSFTTLPQRQRISASPYSVQTRGIVVNEAGNRVGLGTAQPLAPMHIVSPEGILLGVNSSSGGHTTLSIGLSGATSGFARLRATRSSGSEWGNIVLNDAGGNVGIGTSSPQAKLHVQGDSLVTGKVRANGGIEFPGGGGISNMFAAGPFTLDLSPIPAGGLAGAAFPVPGTLRSDFVIATNNPNVFNLYITGAEVQTPGFVTVYFRSASGLTIDPGPIELSFLVIRR